MSESRNGDSPDIVSNIWSRLMLGVAQKRKDLVLNDVSEQLKLSAVERQTENSRKGGTIWEAIRKADEPTFKRLVDEDRENVDARGPVGECPIHMLFLYGSETHLQMARYLITQFPHTITQIYNQPVDIFNRLDFHVDTIDFISFRNIMEKLFYILRSLNAMPQWSIGY